MIFASMAIRGNSGNYVKHASPTEHISLYADATDEDLCRMSLVGNGSGWETRDTWLPAVKEAKSRGFSVADCGVIVAD